MAKISKERKEYLKRYRQVNKERLNELNRQGHRRRKEQRDKDKSLNQSLLDRMAMNKKIRNETMSPSRRKRKETLQQSIYKELEAEKLQCL